MALPIIAIVGRPNVGKSTLFNRLIGERYAITSPVAGTTRDRVYHEGLIAGYTVILADTGGMSFDKKHDLENDVQAQAKIAVDEANIIYFVVDASQQLTANDFDCANYLRKSGKPIVLIAHKSDHKTSESFAQQMFELGLGEAIRVSSIHNLGVEDMEDATEKILKKLKWPKQKPKKLAATQIAIVGKPNVGKSSIVNALLGKIRSIVSDIPGTTVDTIDSKVHRDGHDFVLIDTAGLRRRGRVEQGIERYSVLRALQAISRSDVTCLVLDMETGIANQDLHVSEYILDAKKGLIIVVNKSDLMEDPDAERKKFMSTLHYRMNYMPWAPFIFTSAITKKNIFKIFELARNIAEEREKRIPDAHFKLFTKTTYMSHPPSRSGKTIVISDGVQTDIRPPTFTFTMNDPDVMHFSYKRFLENEIRRKYGFYGTPISLRFKRG